MKRLALPIALWMMLLYGTVPALRGAEAEADAALTMEETCLPATGAEAALAPDTILVKLNDATITQGDLDREIKAVEKIMLRRGLSPDQFTAMLAAFKPQILDGLVIQALLNQECTAQNIVISESEVKAEIAAIEASLPPEQTLAAELAQQGVSLEMLEEQVREQLRVAKLLKITVTAEDIRKFYDENRARLFESVRARHILIATTPMDDAAQKTLKKEKAAKLRQTLVEGGDFAQLARENSDCPSKDQGGELIPPFQRGYMTKPFEDAAFALQPNEISPVVETDFGYHIIQTLEHQTQTFEEVQGRIAIMLKGRATQQQVEPLIRSLKQKAQITYLQGTMPPPEAMFMPTDSDAPPMESASPAPAPQPAESQAIEPVTDQEAAQKESCWSRLIKKIKQARD